MACAIKCIVAVIWVLVARGTMGRLVKFEQSMAEKHERWMLQHGRVYKDAAEKERRFQIFSANVEYIESFNAEGKHKYKLGINLFTDLTTEEVNAKYTGYKSPSTISVTNATSAFRNVNLDDVPPEVDWRASGAVTPVKHQQTCGSCWAFTAAAAMESAVRIKTGNLISLSEQELLDCVTANDGCAGGSTIEAYAFVIKNRGLASELDYPYTSGVVGTCKGDAPKAATISTFGVVTRDDENALRQAVASQPVSTGIDGQGPDFHAYSGGIFTGSCALEMNHGVVIVGYGTTDDDDAIKYWLVKNSWGTSWGEGGYMRIKRDIPLPQGLCGIAKEPFFPIV